MKGDKMIRKKIKSVIKAMREFVKDKDEDWKHIEGGFSQDGYFYKWKIEKEHKLKEARK